ncbi:MAG: DNA-processing protein DprA [Niabella sp.]
MKERLLHQIALTLIPNIGCVQARLLLQQMDAEEIFTAKKNSLLKIEGLGEVRANSIVKFNQFEKAEKEIAFIEKYNITPLFITDNDYPQRLLNCYDPPTMLYYKGGTNLNTSKIIAVVGSRVHTDYGKTLVEKLIGDLAGSDIVVVSGLAYGIDALSHKASLKNKLQTVGVLAHGLDKIYPAENTAMAKEMVSLGGLVTEFMSQKKPDRHNFPSRNRIVAGMSDAVIVVETDIKGGSMITAELANGYNKDVFAFPGKITDKKSSGCNHLIKTNKAVLLTDAHHLLETMGWHTKKDNRKKTKELFVELSSDEKIIVDILKTAESVSIDDINIASGLRGSSVAAAILNLELRNIIQALPGKLYKFL